MPKTFPILIDVEEIAVGRVMRMLNKLPGVAKLHLDLEGVGKSNGAGRTHSADRKPHGRFEVSGEEAILQALNGRPPMTSAQLAGAFEAQGRSPKSISSCLHKLRSEGLINSTHDGYSLTKKSRDRLRHRKSAKRKG